MKPIKIIFLSVLFAGSLASRAQSPVDWHDPLAGVGTAEVDYIHERGFAQKDYTRLPESAGRVVREQRRALGRVHDRLAGDYGAIRSDGSARDAAHAGDRGERRRPLQRPGRTVLGELFVRQSDRLHLPGAAGHDGHRDDLYALPAALQYRAEAEDRRAGGLGIRIRAEGAAAADRRLRDFDRTGSLRVAAGDGLDEPAATDDGAAGGEPRFFGERKTRTGGDRLRGFGSGGVVRGGLHAEHVCAGG